MREGGRERWRETGRYWVERLISGVWEEVKWLYLARCSILKTREKELATQTKNKGEVFEDMHVVFPRE